MEGIGDSLYLRPFIKLLTQDGHKLYLKTPLPELFSDLKVEFVELEPQFRTQRKNYAATTVKRVKAPRVDREISPAYLEVQFMKWGITGALEDAVGYPVGSTRPVWDLPANLPPHGLVLPENKKLAVIRPNSLRREWMVPARNCDPHYLRSYSQRLKDLDFHVVSIADCVEGVEWLEQPEPYADLKLHEGQLGIARTLSLLKAADLVVGSPGFILPATVSAGTHLFLVWGGRGDFDNPEMLFDPRMDMSKVAWAMPHTFCRCRKRLHLCDKRIEQHREKLDAALGQWGLK